MKFLDAPLNGDRPGHRLVQATNFVNILAITALLAPTMFEEPTMELEIVPSTLETATTYE